MTRSVRWRLPLPRPALAEVHGPVMVFGFVGTLVALERAVALGSRWAAAAPACSGALAGRAGRGTTSSPSTPAPAPAIGLPAGATR